MMTDTLSQVNWFAVLFASVAHLVLGGLWYTVLFRDRYASVMGLDAWPRKAPPRFIIGPFICGAVTIAATAVLLRLLGITSYRDALALGLFVGIGYIGATTANIAINPLFPHPYRYALFTVPMLLIGSLVASAILVAFG